MAQHLSPRGPKPDGDWGRVLQLRQVGKGKNDSTVEQLRFQLRVTRTTSFVAALFATMRSLSDSSRATLQLLIEGSKSFIFPRSWSLVLRAIYSLLVDLTVD